MNWFTEWGPIEALDGFARGLEKPVGGALDWLLPGNAYDGRGGGYLEWAPDGTPEFLRTQTASPWEAGRQRYATREELNAMRGLQPSGAPPLNDRPAWTAYGPSRQDIIDETIAESRRRNQAEREKRAKSRELEKARKKKDYIAGWVRDATAGYDGEDGLLAQIKADADDSVSEVHRVNAGLLAPLEESKAEAGRARDEIKRMEGANRRRRDRVSDAETDATTGALGAGFIGSGNQEMDRAADLARASSAGQQAGVNREANLAARDAQAWAGEMQDWAQADAAEAAKDIRKSEQRLLAQARRERAQAVAQARREGTLAYDAAEQNRRAEWRDVQRTRAEAQNAGAESQMQMLMQIAGLIPKQVDTVIGMKDGEPVTAPEAAFPPEVLLALMSGDPQAFAQILAQRASGSSASGGGGSWMDNARGTMAPLMGRSA